MDERERKIRQQDKEVFDAVFKAAVKGDGLPYNEQTEYTSLITPLGNSLRILFNEYEKDRMEIEDVWLKALRQNRGEYDPEIKTKMHPKRSKAFLSLTRTKTHTVTARMTDLLFPANKEKNWSVTITPVPELNPAIIQDIALQFEQSTGEPASEEFIRKELNKEASKRCEAMEKEIEDQLAELKYRYTIRQVIKDGNIYGTGILKGPLVKQRIVKRWLPQGEDWVTVRIKRLSPWCEHVAIWDWYPDMSARTMDNIRGCFQRHVLSRHRVLELAKRSDFNGDAIRAHLKMYPEGDATYKTWEQNLMTMNRAGVETTGYKETTIAGTSALGGGSNLSSRRNKYEVLEYWGYMSTHELAQAGIDIDEDIMDIDVAVNVWLLGNIIIKAVISGIEGVEIPYHLYYYEKDDTSILGEGLPMIMRHAQKLFNASIRAMLDNAAISAGPIIEVNVDLLDASEDPRDIYPFRVFVRDGTGSEAMAQAVHVYEVQSHTAEFMTLAQFFMTAADEVTTVPRYLYGEPAKIGGAGKTASGLSMLMGAANVTLKDQVKNFDDGITKPYIKGMYSWNMEFNEKEHIKGDFSIVAKGSTSLIAREVKAEGLNQFLNITNNPVDQMYCKRDNVLREVAKVMDLDDLDLIKDKEQIAMEEEARAQDAKEEKEFLRELAKLKAESGGHVDKDLSEQTGLGHPQQDITSA